MLLNLHRRTYNMPELTLILETHYSTSGTKVGELSSLIRLTSSVFECIYNRRFEFGVTALYSLLLATPWEELLNFATSSHNLKHSDREFNGTILTAFGKLSASSQAIWSSSRKHRKGFQNYVKKVPHRKSEAERCINRMHAHTEEG